MGNRKKRAPGPQQHAEGQHGEKTHRRFLEQLHERQNAAASEPPADTPHRSPDEREQHDDAEHESQRTGENSRR